MTYRIVRDDGLIIARGIMNGMVALQECAQLRKSTGHKYSIANDDRETVKLNVRDAD